MEEPTGAKKMRDIAALLSKELKGLGFALVVFEFGKEGASNYISNAKRENMTKALFEAAYRLKADEDYKTPEIKE